MKSLRVLFVCKANIGRSQALREFTQAHLRSANFHDKVIVDSAGTSDSIKEEIKDPAKRSISPGLAELYAKVFGITREMPTRKPVDHALLAKNDVVLVAEPNLKRDLHTRFPEHAHKILTVKEYLWPTLNDRSQVIDDPPHPVTARYRKIQSKRGRNYKMLRECEGIAKRLVERWKHRK